MKKLVFLMAMVLVVFAANAQEEKAVKDGPVITFEESSKDFGDIKQGDKVEHTFI